VAYYGHLWHVRIYHIFPHYFVNGTIFKNKKLNTKFQLLFPYNIRLKHSQSNENSATHYQNMLPSIFM